MFERFLGFLRELPGASHEDDSEDPRIAAAALLVHVMDADGARQDVERERIKAILAETYNIGGSALERLLNDGEKADSEAIDLYAFTSVLKRNLDEDARIDFVRLLWEVCYADGELHELEDNTLWRIAELLGVASRERIAARIAVKTRIGSRTIN
ncbi:MAG: TerB family tellurite resistance protein [Rhizobiaceae bacterium]|nr:TerB family tellurite resistance protein [Rhizobiaceae bacterium]